MDGLVSVKLSHPSSRRNTSAPTCRFRAQNGARQPPRHPLRSGSKRQRRVVATESALPYYRHPREAAAPRIRGSKRSYKKPIVRVQDRKRWEEGKDRCIMGHSYEGRKKKSPSRVTTRRIKTAIKQPASRVNGAKSSLLTSCEHLIITFPVLSNY